MTSMAKRQARRQSRIVHDPKVCAGEARVAGTRIPVHNIVRCWEYNQDLAEVLEAYPQLDADAVEQALAYYREHPEEIRQAMADNERLAYGVL